MLMVMRLEDCKRTLYGGNGEIHLNELFIGNRLCAVDDEI